MADEADDYFEFGLGYLKTGFFSDARAAFAESLVRAPGEAVPTAFTALACAGEGRDSRSCAYLLRLAYRRLPEKQTLKIDLDRHLRSARDRERIEARFRARLKDAKGAQRIDNLTVLAFFEVHGSGSTPGKSKALAALLKARPDDVYAIALQAPAKKPAKKKAPEKKKTPEKKKPNAES